MYEMTIRSMISTVRKPSSGAIIIVNLAIGMVTPPVGVNLFVVAQIANIKIEAMIAPLLGFLTVLIIDLMIISYIPALSTILIR